MGNSSAQQCIRQSLSPRTAILSFTSRTARRENHELQIAGVLHRDVLSVNKSDGGGFGIHFCKDKPTVLDGCNRVTSKVKNGLTSEFLLYPRNGGVSSSKPPAGGKHTCDGPTF